MTSKKLSLNLSNVLAVFLDLQNAFDLTWHKGLLFKLKEYGITGTIFKWVRSFLQGRSIQVRVGSSLSERENLERGTPQGSVISPTLFNIIINDYAKIVSAKDSGIVVSQFADDSSEWLIGNHLNDNFESTKSLNLVSEWAVNWGFKISAEKTIGVVFCNKNKKNTAVTLTLGGTPVKFEKHAKFVAFF